MISQTDSKTTPTGVLRLLVWMAMILWGSTLLGCTPADSTGAADAQDASPEVSAQAFDEVETVLDERP